MNELDNIKVVDDSTPVRIAQLEATTNALRRLQAASVCLRDALRERKHLTGRTQQKIELADGDVNKTIAELHERIAALDPEVRAFEMHEEDNEKQRHFRATSVHDFNRATQ
jgi:hypothetical protein